MSERVQLLLSERILGMTLVPEGRVWNYGIGLTQLWSPNLGYSMTLDTPLLFWAEEHRPATFLTVRTLPTIFTEGFSVLIGFLYSLRILSREMTVRTWKIALLDVSFSLMLWL